MAKKKTGSAAKEPTFEEAMTGLEGIVRELEEAEIPLEKSLEIFEEGVRLSRFLNRKLNEAEKKVEILLKGEEGEKVPRPFDPDREAGEGESEGDASEQGGLPF
jgi:exodeoxyribonuclease VII small subunit